MYKKEKLSTETFPSNINTDQIIDVIGQMLEAIQHCLNAANLNVKTDTDHELLMIAAWPGKGIQVKEINECFEVLSVFGDTDSVIQAPECDLMMSYNERQVLELDGKEYLIGPAILYRVNYNGDEISVTAKDIYNIQRMIKHHTVTLRAHGRAFPAWLLRSLSNRNGDRHE